MFVAKEWHQPSQTFASPHKLPRADSGIHHGPALTPAHLLRRGLGNSYLQSITETDQALEPSFPLTGESRIQRACACGGACGNCSDKEDKLHRIQTKLTISQPGDIYEQEADRVAEQVLRIPDSSQHTAADLPQAGVNIQRFAHVGDSARQSPPEIQLSEGGGQPLSPSTRQYMEPRFGADFGHVQLHSDEVAHRTASQIQARAFTYGHHIWLGKGESEQDKGLMAHELTHVIQQNSALSKSVQRSCGEATPPAENHATIRAEIVSQARSQLGEHYLWSTEGERPGLGDVIMDPLYQGVARVAGGCVCSGRHTEPDVMARPHLEATQPDPARFCMTHSFLRTEGAGDCGGGCVSAAGNDIWGECCIGHRHFDCSGFVHWSYQQAGYNINRTNVAGYQGCDRNIAQPDLQPGDLCYIGDHHIGMYAGGNQVIEARAHNFGVVLTNFGDRGWTSFGSLF